MALDREAIAALFDEAAAGVVVLSTDGVVAVNPAGRRLLGLGDAVEVKDLPGAALARAALDGRPPETTVIDVPRADGQGALLATWTPIRDAGRVIAAIGLFQDATVLARREHRLHEMLAHVAHELRTPLTPILGWARMLLQKPPVEPTVQRAAEVIERNVRLEVRLVDDLLDLSRLQRGILPLDRQPVDVRDACRGAVEEVRGLLAARSLTLAEQHATDPLWVEGDPVRLQQLVTSLLDRAIKLAGDGGLVEMTTSHAGAEVVASVRHAGPPVCARRPEPGLSVGIAVARHLAELHGGTLETLAASADGDVGFSLRLPYRAPAVAGR